MQGLFVDGGVLEGGSGKIFYREDGLLAARPFDLQSGIVPQNGALMLGRVKISGFIEHLGALGNDHETVGKAGRNP